MTSRLVLKFVNGSAPTRSAWLCVSYLPRKNFALTEPSRRLGLSLHLGDLPVSRSTNFGMTPGAWRLSDTFLELPAKVIDVREAAGFGNGSYFDVRRQKQLLRQQDPFAAEPGPGRGLHVLLEQAPQLCGANASYGLHVAFVPPQVRSGAHGLCQSHDGSWHDPVRVAAQLAVEQD